MNWRSIPFVGLFLLFGFHAAHAVEIDAQALEFFESKVRPILVEHCQKCHAADSKKIRGGLLVDSRDGLLTGGDTGPAIVPGKPDESLLIQAVRYDDELVKMPPKGKLSDDQIAILTDWVRRGAPDPRDAPSAARPERKIDLAAGRQHWSFQPLSAPEPPASGETAWPKSPIDQFILAKLVENGLKPAEEANRRVLIRRAYFDLIGLPPTPEQVQAFLDDKADNAYEKVIDGLLASPHYGERWARHWLDLARFAESHGFEHDYDRPTAYPYRDFVIEAFNSDLPYDQFVKWQLAGDEFEPQNPLALKATGFLAAGMHSTQITANQVEKERYDELDDMANTTGTAFLGLTIGCARCHDHKFDPILQSDYYRFLSTFTTTVRSEIDLTDDPDRFAKATARYQQEHAEYSAALQRFETEQLPSRLAGWERSRPAAPEAPAWVVLSPSKLESKGGATFKPLADGSILVEGNNVDFDTYTITAASDLQQLTALKIEALADPSLVLNGPGRAPNGNFDLTDVQVVVGPRYGIGTTTKPRLINPKATFEQPGLPISATIDGDPKSGWAVDPQFGKDHAAVYEFGADLHPDGGATLTITLDFQGNNFHNFGRFRIAVTASPRPVGLDATGIPPEQSAILAIPAATRTAEQTAKLLSWYKTIDLEWRSLNESLREHAKTEPRQTGQKALISTEGLPAVRLHTQGADYLEKTHFLKRGDVNQKGDEATQSFLQVLMPPDADASRWQEAPPEGWRTSYRRRSLANWMTDVDAGAGSLLARVIVNRLWQHHFGRGIVATPSDFGTQGDPPSHPKLLDWLASELVREGWRLKPIQKQILMSAAYRQSSHLDPESLAADPANALISHQTRQRLEAEPFRDSMLAVSGQLDERLYGPGSLDENSRRRSIYFMIKRSKLIPMMTLFDAPDALTPIAVRSSTTVAPQSLMILNNPFIRELAEQFARSVSASGDEPAAIDRAYQVALGRPPTVEELSDARGFLRSQRDRRRSHGEPEPDAKAFADFCQILFGLNEFIFIE
jgi:hypothetical protein